MRLFQVPSYGHSQRLYCRYASWHVRNGLSSRRFCSDKIQWFFYAKRKLRPHHVRRSLELSYESNTPTGCRNGGILSSCTLSIAAVCERFLDGSRHSGMKRIALPAPFGRRLTRSASATAVSERCTPSSPCRCWFGHVTCIRSRRLVYRHPGPQQRSAKHRAVNHQDL